MKSPNKIGWIAAIDKEIKLLPENYTFNLTAKLDNPAITLLFKWGFRTELNADGTRRFKARLAV